MLCYAKLRYAILLVYKIALLTVGKKCCRVFVLSINKCYVTKNSGKKPAVNIAILHSKTTRRCFKDWNFSEISKTDEEDEHSPTDFYYPEDLETFDIETETGITECHIINNLLTELRSLRTATTEDQDSAVRPEQARLVSH